MVIKNAYAYTTEHQFEKKDLFIQNGRFAEEKSDEAGRKPDEEVLDADGLYAVPGLVDIHFHGAMGYDFCNATGEELQKIAAYEAAHGILAICPATMSYDEETLTGIMDKAWRYRSSLQADLVGINLEGPFLNREKAGAQNPEYIMPADADMFHRLQQKSNGLIKLVDLAPEFPASMSFIEQCHEEVRISLAHTNCDYETAREAFTKGASHVTHLYNGMAGIHHRKPGLIPAAMEAGAEVELITDGIHIHPAMVRFTFRTFGADKVILISDSMEAAGLSDGSYQLGGQAVTVTGAKACLTGHPDVIAGSVTNLFDCMRNCVLHMRVPLEQAIQAATENPAKAIGIERDYGRIAPGNYGNLILLDKELRVHKIIQKGKILESTGWFPEGIN